MSVTPLQALPLDLLRQRTSTKWTKYGADILPFFVAETDYALAPAISRALTRAVELGDTGYTPPAPGIRETFVGFAERRLAWTVDPSHVFWTADVIMGVVEILRRVIEPGERVVVMPPVYPPFYDTVEEAGGVVERVPLSRTSGGWELDLAGIDAALAGGARAILLCNPHNPTGTVHSSARLRGLAEIAERHGVPVISDEIHAPLTHAPAVFTPFLAASEAARAIGYAVTSVSKTFNLAGLKCAIMVGGSDRQANLIRRLPWEVEWRTGHFGAIAHIAACRPESDAWVDSLLAALDENRRVLTELLSAHLPLARYIEPDAGYLAWVDVSAYGWGDNPARKILRDAKVAFHHGPLFGDEGKGHVRINFGCSPDLLRDAIERVGALVRS
ncbi:MalY/PatB family protein [Microbacterium sp. SLBN-146]|uniref:MalY/PatB family protein n=1 Tax=Microbacterium sp. SLBN-146 TaxID=2768457 RepID=UPI0011541B0C|nr:aminotransferase class I/II-fold pyridoxal phosphate-dependent enzyme [Microbacterium sp. SLBN-146]TQJ32296.1 cystathionine beta-lyase [Microbacterium sp. SLBN-146]